MSKILPPTELLPNAAEHIPLGSYSSSLLLANTPTGLRNFKSPVGTEMKCLNKGRIGRMEKIRPSRLAIDDPISFSGRTGIDEKLFVSLLPPNAVGIGVNSQDLLAGHPIIATDHKVIKTGVFDEFIYNRGGIRTHGTLSRTLPMR